MRTRGGDIYPVGILNEIESGLAAWFSKNDWRGSDEGKTSRQSLLDYIAKLEDAWDRPRA